MDQNIKGNASQPPNLYNNLCLILQAIYCYINVIACNHPNCPQLIDLFNHIRNCEKAEECSFPKCIQTIGHMKHYLNCNLNVCVCFKFGMKSPENKSYARVKDILLRNQFLIWRRKITPFRQHLLSKISEYLTGGTNDGIREAIFHHLCRFDDANFEKAKGMSTYLTNLAKHANELLTKMQMNQLHRDNPGMSIQQLIGKIDQNGSVAKIYSYLQQYSADVLHGRIKLEPQKSEPLPPADHSKPCVKAEPSVAAVKAEPAVAAMESPQTNSSTLTPPISASSLKSSPEVAVRDKCDRIWSRADLQALFEPLHERLCREKDAEVFLHPVDWKLLEIPDYPRIISHPMDLSTIGARLAGQQHYSDPWDVVADYWLMFNNAWTYNKRSSRVYKMCSSVARTFETLADELMRSMGLCCGHDYVYLPQVLICCTPQMCVVNRDAVYYAIDNTGDVAGTDSETGSARNTNQRLVPELGCDKYVCCDKCFTEAPDAAAVQLMVSESTATLVPVEKSLFTKLKNNVKEREEFVSCRGCQRRWHKVCAEHIDEIWSCGFYCPRCETGRPFPKQPNVLTAASLPHCDLSRHIEACIDDWRQSQAGDAAVSKITIRTLSISKKSAEIKPEMRRIFVENGEMPEYLPYKLKAIFAFQQQADGSEICLFGMHTQEYGSDCPSPNARRIYLAYLDSVNFFEPQRLRTEFYHRLLIAYLDYCRQLGFVFAHIWACPPGEGDDYIFHMHPPSQKLPKPKRLQEWYIAMLDKAVQEGVAVDYSDIFTYAYSSQLMSVSELPYFEGDYWPTVIEDLLKEEAQSPQQSMTNGCGDMVEDDVKDSDLSMLTVELSKKRKLKKIAAAASSHSLSKRRRQSDAVATVADGCNDTMKRLFDLMERRKENFFVVRLHSQADAFTLPLIDDSDQLGWPSDLMDGRDKFLSLSRDKHLEFSSVRRAKFATLVLCYELHLELHHGIIYSCNRCSLLLLDGARFTCPICDEFELCERCAASPNAAHPHELQRMPPSNQTGVSVCATTGEACDTAPVPATTVSELGSNVASRNSRNAMAGMSADQKQLILVKILAHTLRCRDANCRTPNCHELKNRINHRNECQNRSECRTCVTLTRVIRWHNHVCRDPACNVPFCTRKNAPKDRQDRLRQLASERQRMMSTATAAAPNGMPAAVVLRKPVDQYQCGGAPQQLMMTSHHQQQEQNYQRDVYTVLANLEHIKRNPQATEADFNKFLVANPQLRESWQCYLRFQQQQQQQQQHQQQQQQFYHAPQPQPMARAPPFYPQQQQTHQLAHQQANQTQLHIQQPQIYHSNGNQQQLQSYVVQTQAPRPGHGGVPFQQPSPMLASHSSPLFSTLSAQFHGTGGGSTNFHPS